MYLTQSKNEKKEEEEKNVLETLLRVFLTTIQEESGLSASEISMDNNAEDVFKNSQEAYAEALGKLHQYFGLQRNYKRHIEFKMFPKLGDAYEYIAIQTLIHDGLLYIEES